MVQTFERSDFSLAVLAGGREVDLDRGLCFVLVPLQNTSLTVNVFTERDSIFDNIIEWALRLMVFDLARSGVKCQQG